MKIKDLLTLDGYFFVLNLNLFYSHSTTDIVFSQGPQ